VTYLLDTNACIAIINGRPAEVRRRLQEACESDVSLVTSSVVAFELWYGVAKSQRQDANAERLKVFFSGPIDVVDLDAEDARQAGEVRAALEAVGRPIGAYDLLIAGQAVRRGWRLVTANCGEFVRVADLDWEDWSTPAAD
jgi:tRNA(fMet)-specific endonuclease VapC